MFQTFILAVVCCLPHVGFGDRQECKRDDSLLQRQTIQSSALTLDRTLGRKPGFVPIKPKENKEEWEAIKTMFSVKHGHDLGVGRDTAGWDAVHGKYDDLQVITALRLNYSDESESAYRHEKKTLLDELRRAKQTSFTNIKGLKTRQSGQALVKVLKGHGIDINPALNEALLFHATKDANVLSIIDQGLKDSRCDGWFLSGCVPSSWYCGNSLFGCGVYLADEIEKADQYATAVDPSAWSYNTIETIAQQHVNAALKRFMIEHNTHIFYAFIVKALLGKTAVMLENKSNPWQHLEFSDRHYVDEELDQYHSQFMPAKRTDSRGMLLRFNEVTVDPFGRRSEIVYVVVYTRCKGSGFRKKVKRFFDPAFSNAERAWSCKESMKELQRLQEELSSR